MGGGIDKCLRDANIREATIYIEKHIEKQKTIHCVGGGGCRFSIGGGKGGLWGVYKYHWYRSTLASPVSLPKNRMTGRRAWKLII